MTKYKITLETMVEELVERYPEAVFFLPGITFAAFAAAKPYGVL